MQTRSIALVCALIWQTVGLALAEVPGLEVSEAVLTSGVNERTPLRPGLEPSAKIKEGPVYFWTMLTGNAEALKFLGNGKARPIYHRWTLQGRQGMENDRPELLGDNSAENLDTGVVGQTKALASEIDSAGKFNWRTWTLKKHLRQGIYTIEVLFSDGKPVRQNGKPCVYTFAVVAG